MKKPNILLIFPDQWRFDGFSALGNPVAETPFLAPYELFGLVKAGRRNPGQRLPVTEAWVRAGQPAANQQGDTT